MTKGVGGSTVSAELAALGPWPDPAPPITAGERGARRERARDLAAREGAHALIVGAGASLRYFAGVVWGASERLLAMILPAKGGAPVFICPAFERGSLEVSLDGALATEADIQCWEEHEDPYALTVSVLNKLGVRRAALDPDMAFGMAARLAGAAREIEAVPGSAIVDGCRMRKSPAEIALMRQAKSMTLEAHRRAARILAPGITTADVRDFISEAHRRLGAAGSTFCIILFGEATSYPHGVPREQTLREGDVVLIDTGCNVEGYHSDITRTYVFGNPCTDVRRIWEVEKMAQGAAFEAARLGAPCENVDAAARRVLAQNGFSPDYRLPGLPHRTGHGVGLSIHEAPYLVRGDATPLEVGMCFSNEPMIVVPGRFGVRLEDHFYMSENGPVWFTQPSPSLDAPFG
ncbi:M24 family metallopeptidase [Amphiplicatus metriothermophilus]|uniref:Xaa-Pro dipeptidase n=1 Tax=Amphiplicatus metriothermophilus TaxID=1519374 RepID=A0A239PQN4_9PROT|nr:Xaa-Pro peptidase family protein [Amphiplicatus metriothermophilus]MBB5518400.1 Xaa-Pro dipeptidase [Amphiplicatus metriothermophilus]SNT72438.1 Xaa-Pro dipeptidase [Amphiplicatus metriothermophilus]